MKKITLIFTLLVFTSCTMFWHEVVEDTKITQTDEIKIEEQKSEIQNKKEFIPETKTQIFLLRWAPNINTWSVDGYLIPLEIQSWNQFTQSDENLKFALSVLLGFKKPTTELGETYTALFASDLRLENIILLEDKTLVNFWGEFKTIGIFSDYAHLQIEKTVAQYFDNYVITLNGTADNWLCQSKKDTSKCVSN